MEEQRRLQGHLNGVLEDRAEAQAENARSLEMLRSHCQEKELELQEKEELLQSEKKVKESIVAEMQKVKEALLGREGELLDLRRQNQEITENKATQGETIVAL